MATRPWTPADLSQTPTAWIYAQDDAAFNAAGEVYAGAQPASEYLPSVVTDEAARPYLEGASGHAGYIVAAGTEDAFNGASGAAILAVHRLPSGLPADKAVVVSTVTDAEGGDAFALRYGSETPGGGGGGGIIFPDVAIAVQPVWQYTLVVDT